MNKPRLLDWLGELLFPPRCIICRKFLSGGAPRICPACEKTLPLTPEGSRSHGDFFSECVSPLYYEGAFRSAFTRYKFQNAQSYAAAFGELLAACIYQELPGRYDLVTWAPLGKKRLRRRGYDQARLLAENACRRLCVKPVCLLRKRPNTKPQSGTGSPEKRRANIAGAYSVIDRELVRDKRILVIDDIITSGATLCECARTLLMAGADEVLCATLAKTR